MTGFQALELLSDIKEQQKKASGEFSISLMENEESLTDYVEKVKKAFSTDKIPNHKEYESKRIELAKKHAIKDEKGNPKTKKNENGLEIFDIEESKRKALQKDLEALMKEYKEVVEEAKKLNEDVVEYLKKEARVTLYKIDRGLIPQSLTSEDIRSIRPIIQMRSDKKTEE